MDIMEVRMPYFMDGEVDGDSGDSGDGDSGGNDSGHDGGHGSDGDGNWTGD